MNFLFWRVKSICYDNNNGVDSLPYTQPHSITATLPKRDYIVLLVINEKHKASVGLLPPSRFIDLNVILILQWRAGLISCRGELALIACYGMIFILRLYRHRHISNVIRSPGNLWQVLSRPLCVDEILGLFFTFTNVPYTELYNCSYYSTQNSLRLIWPSIFRWSGNNISHEF